MNSVNSALDSATVLFGLVMVLCVTVTGFFVGRVWLRRAGMEEGGNEDSLGEASDPTERGWRGASFSEDGRYVTVSSDSGDRHFKREDYDRWVAGGMKGTG